MNDNDPFKHFKLVAKKGEATFGLTILAANVRHALVKARKMLEGSGYSVYPYKD